MKNDILEGVLGKLSALVIVAIAIIMIMPSATPIQKTIGQQQTPVSRTDSELYYTVTFSEKDLLFGTLMGYDTVQFTDGSCMNEIGKPTMPVKEINIALPPGIAEKQVRIISTQSIDIPGKYSIFPAQPPRVIGSSDENAAFVAPDATTYTSHEQYPAKLVEFVGQTDLVGQGIAVLNIFPVQYTPLEKKLSLYTSITFAIIGSDGYVCGDYLPQSISENGRTTYEQMVKDMVMNPEDVQVHEAPQGTPQTLSLPPGGPYAHVIITTNALSSYWAPLVEWHTKRGLKDIVVTTENIYANYSGSTNQAKIRAFVIDAFNTWGTTYFLMGGEPSAVPLEFRTYYDESTPSDEYYSDFDDDWTNEVYVGRATTDSATQIDTFIDKVLFYERTPPLTDYILKALLVGMDADASTHCSVLKEVIDGYIPASFIVTKVYDSDGGNHKTAVVTALNAGQQLFNHADHGSYTYMGTGDFHHGWGIYNSDVDGLTNNNKMTIVTSLACDVNGFDYSDSISEHFVVYNPMQAGIAFNGNTRLGWYTVGQPQSLSGQLDRDWWRGLFSYNQYILGQTIVWSKHQFPQNSGAIYKHCEWEFNLLGEPSMPIWTATPTSFTVTYPAELPTGSSSFTVHVTNSTGSPVSQAYVCLWKGTEVYMTGSTNSAGDVTFTPSPTSYGTLYVTVTKQNYLPYEGTATVIGKTDPPTTPLDATAWHTYANDKNKGIGGQEIQYTYTTSSNAANDLYFKFYWGDGTDSGWIGPYSAGQPASASHTWTQFGYYTITATVKISTSGPESDPSTPLNVRMYKLGDTSANDAVGFDDINPFVMILTSGKYTYYSTYPDGYYFTADITKNHIVDFGDINPFVALLSGL